MGKQIVFVKVSGVQETMRAFDLLPKAAEDSLRKRSRELVETLSGRIRTAAQADSRQSARAASSVKPGSGRLPSVVAGGGRRASAVIFGSEFGAKGRFGWYARKQFSSSRARQFRPHLGQGSYWFFKTVENEDTGAIAAAWSKVADDIVRSFVKGA
jgi:hypothetical protein